MHPGKDFFLKHKSCCDAISSVFATISRGLVMGDSWQLAVGGSWQTAIMSAAAAIPSVVVVVVVVPPLLTDSIDEIYVSMHSR